MKLQSVFKKSNENKSSRFKLIIWSDITELTYLNAYDRRSYIYLISPGFDIKLKLALLSFHGKECMMNHNS